MNFIDKKNMKSINDLIGAPFHPTLKNYYIIYKKLPNT